MATSLSEEEFQRMQTQLLELRTKNYMLGEKNHQIQTELLQNNLLLENLRKELAKCQKIISKSKNTKDIEQLMQENEALQRKLQMQEDEFRLQNETLMKELSSLVYSNEELKKELELAKSQVKSTSDTVEFDYKVKLEAENVALRELLSLQDKEVSDEQFTAETKKEMEFILKSSLEEKALLHDNIKKMQKEYQEQILKIQNENEKLAEKLKKKQESFLRLQEEKELLYIENKKSFENLQLKKDKEIQQLKEQILSIQADLRKSLHLNEYSVEKVEMNEEKDATVEFMDGEKAAFECSLSETKLSLANFNEKMQTLNNQLQISENKMKELEKINNELQMKIQDLEKHKIDLEEELLEKSKLAEKRKSLMDEMNNHLIETTNKHSREIENLTRQLSDEQDALQKLFDKEKDTQLKLLDSRNEVQTLKDEIHKLKTAHSGADIRIKELEEDLQKATLEYENSLRQKEEEHTEIMESIKQELEAKIEDFRIQLEVARVEKSEYEEKVIVLQQEAKDSLDERKIQEKKGLAMVKDLKRQLQVERKRVEKLQERLQEILNEQNRNVDEILPSSNVTDKSKGDASSISSWSYVSGGTADRENRESTVQSDNSSGGHESPNRISPTLLESETNNLLDKITLLQENNWTLEEKVNHLEKCNQALVDDVLKKSALIEFYCMEGKSDPHASVMQDKLTIKRIVDFIKDKGDENLREINRKMQRMLEETLTKNMHLQKDIETLSNEVSRLSKMVNSPVENGIQSAVFVDGV